MLFIHLFALLGILLFALSYMGAGLGLRMPKNSIRFLISGALLLRLLAAVLSEGFGTDIACFAAWADRIYQVHPAAFYSPEIFTDYPPGYMYVLWLLGAVKHLFHLEQYSVPHLLLLKLPAILCDMACGLLLYRQALKKHTESHAFFLCLAYLFNPAVILNSSVWGQVDSILALIVALMCLYLVQGRMYAAYIAFGTGILIKPHTLLFAPVLLAGFLDHVVFREIPGTAGKDAARIAVLRIRRIGHSCLQGVTVLCGMVILCLPFGLKNVWNQYFNTVSSYPYAAVNACNFWGLWGLNWVSQDETFLGIPCRVLGWGALFAAVACVLFLSLRNRKQKDKYPFLAALMICTAFLFSVRMHERYLYPALLLLLLASVFKPSGLLLLCYAGFSILHFYNTADVLFFYDPANYDRHSPLIVFVSAGMLLGGILLFYTTRQLYGKKAASCAASFPSFSLSPKTSSHPKAKWAPRASEKKLPLRRADLLCMSVIILLYACVALYHLGDHRSPSTAFDMTKEQSLEFDFGEEEPVSLSCFIAPWHDRNFTLEGKREDSETWTSFGKITFKNVFTWQTVSVDTGMSRLRLTLQDEQASILELVFLDGEGKPITPVFSSFYGNLFDEAELYPGVSTCRNSMYFDEIYHARTAYEFLHGLVSYENTHPPLGKILIALGVALFGMNPFGWRIVGTFFGILMVPMVYLFARRLSRDTPLAALACVLFAFDFMHFTQTRIATIDVYITFFVIMMYYFMHQYASLSFYDTSLKRTLLPLGACGLCMGLGIACKWTGIYAGLGLAVIFFSVLYRRYREYVYAGKDVAGSTNGISHRHVVESFLPYTRKTILFCLVFFVLLPAVIYLLSYLPFRDYSDRGLIGRLIYNQNTMFSYHSNLESTHDFASAWYEWPIIKRPIWYYSRIVESTADGLREGISAFGNPAVWWIGIPASLYMIWLWLGRRDRTAAFLIVGYMAQYLPWFFVTRITFIYHYFPSVVFVVLMIIYSFCQWKEKLSRRTLFTLAFLYGAAAVGLFVLFYPVLSGEPVEAAFVDKYLRWFKTWVLTAK